MFEALCTDTEVALANRIVGWINRLKGEELHIVFALRVEYELLNKLIDSSSVALEKVFRASNAGFALREDFGSDRAHAVKIVEAKKRGLDASHPLIASVALRAAFEAVSGLV